MKLKYDDKPTKNVCVYIITTQRKSVEMQKKKKKRIDYGIKKKTNKWK